jgi:hypothetical protein
VGNQKTFDIRELKGFVCDIKVLFCNGKVMFRYGKSANTKYYFVGVQIDYSRPQLYGKGLL